MRRLGIFLVRAYQVTVGPLFSGACRFEPSCSNYSIQALERFGLLRGSWLTARRLLRCRPFGPHGYDPVPETWPGLFGALHGALPRPDARPDRDSDSVAPRSRMM